jgi:methyl-accepting chemotaxis protein
MGHMGFRVFDVLYAVVLVLAAVAVAAAFYLVEPYPAVIVAAFAAGAATFLYLTVRVKLGGIVQTVDRRLAEQEAEAAQHREALEKSFADIERLTRTMREQLQAANDKSLQDIGTLRANVRTIIDKFNGQLEKMATGMNELKKSLEADAATAGEKIAALENGHEEAGKTVLKLSADFDAFVSDESAFRENIESRLAERVTYLEDFIREKRKSLQI